MDIHITSSDDIDMRKVRAALESAGFFVGTINTHQRDEDAPDLPPLVIQPASHDPRAMFLRTGWAEGNAGDGTPFEIAQSGPTVLFTLGDFDDDARVVESIPVQSLAKAFLTRHGKA